MGYHRILLCVDNSADSDAACRLTGQLAHGTDATVVAAHVYAARLHDRRFQDLEPGLPSEYQRPERLEQSRKTHDSLIGRGLALISDSYLAAARQRLPGIAVDGRNIEGKHYVELAREAAAGGYDLAVIGATGLGLASMNGTAPPGAIGSVCERFLRRVRSDVLVTRGAAPIGGTVLVGVDGSPESYGALRTALRLAEAQGARVKVVACFDPAYHPVAFKSIAAVLSEADAKLFHFRSQERLHEQIIDRGLENVYRGYLDNAVFVAQGRAAVLDTELLTGKPPFAIAQAAAACGASLVVLGRYGMHRTDDLDLGATAEAVVRVAPCHVLLVNARPDPTPVAWTDEAEARLAVVPEFMRPMVRKAIESHARARGLTEVTAQVVTDAKQGHGVRLPGHGRTGDSGGAEPPAGP